MKDFIERWLTDDRRAVLKNRALSFIWRAGGLIVAVGLSEAQALVTELHLPVAVSTILGLIIGELTKYHNVDRRRLEEAEL